MATFDISPLFRGTTGGLDRAWNHLNTALQFENSGYPAYNIARVSDDEFRISLAVPGFADSDIEIESREGSVWVKGNRESESSQYLYRGIDAQSFQRTFKLPDHVKVKGARLETGILHIDLYRELPEALRPRRIEIETAGQTKSVIGDSSKAA